MAVNTLTGLIPTIYQALDMVSRELVGMITACTLDAGATRAAVGQTILVPIAPPAPAENIVAAQLPPDTGAQIIGNTPISITKARTVPFQWTGEEVRGIDTGVGFQSLRTNQIAQCFRTLANEMESDLCGLFTRASRAFGTPAQPLFNALTLVDAAEIRRMLVDNGAPENDLQLVINTAAGAKLRTIPNLSRVSEAGNDSLLRQGVLLDLLGFNVRESGQIKTPAKGTSPNNYTTTAAGFAVGTTTIPLITGTGTIIAGDRVTFASDATNIYVVETGVTAAGQNLILAQPGLRVALPASTQLVTLGALAALNMAFHRSAIILVQRPPALPPEGDAASDRILLTDPRSGLTFELSVYGQYKRVRYEIGACWGVAGIKQEHTVVGLG
jgi:hypothetical protein